MRENLGLYRGRGDHDWIRGNLFSSFDGTVFIVCEWHAQELFHYQVDPETVGQYTGFPDRSGKKIFEGDICHFYNDDGESSLYEVIWKDFGWKVKEVCSGGIDDLDEFFCKRCEVVGNIYDNPELLDKDKSK